MQQAAANASLKVIILLLKCTVRLVELEIATRQQQYDFLEGCVDVVHSMSEDPQRSASLSTLVRLV